MITIKELRERLSGYPDDAMVYPYEGEVTGIVIVEHDGNELGFIRVDERDEHLPK